MNTTEISDAVAQAVEYLRDHPSEAKYTDSAATAVLEGSLRVTVTGPDGAKLTTDMPKSIGGRGESPSPGWFLRAAEASCLASLIGMVVFFCLVARHPNIARTPWPGGSLGLNLPRCLSAG